MIPQPADDLPVHLHPDGFKIPELPIISRKELSPKDFGGGKSIMDDRLHIGRKTKSPQADPDDSLPVDPIEYRLDDLTVIPFPLGVVNEGIEM